MTPQEALIPLRNMILIERDPLDPGAGMFGAIVPPSSVTVSPMCSGTILSLGPECFAVAQGQRVLWNKHSATGVGLVDGSKNELVLLAQEEVLLLLKEGS